MCNINKIPLSYSSKASFCTDVLTRSTYQVKSERFPEYKHTKQEKLSAWIEMETSFFAGLGSGHTNPQHFC